MTKAQEKALVRLKKMVWECGSMDTIPEGEGSSYEMSAWDETHTEFGTIYVLAIVRKKNPRTLGHRYPKVFHIAVRKGGAMFQLNAKSTKTDRPLRSLRITRGPISIYTV